ncbi:MAG: CDP-alcohol phosphatidyltransferase family protein [Patescibacteria group bacterium]
MTHFQRAKNGFEAAVLWLIPAWIHPNVFTVLRALLVIPVIIWKDLPPVSFTALVVSSVFDILDGWLARKRGLVSTFGKIFDPISDKIFTLGTLCFACWDRVDSRIAWAIVIGEVLLTLIRPIQMLRKIETAASAWGSAKTWTQAIGLGCILVHVSWFVRLSPFVLCLAILIAGLSLFGHVRRLFVRRAPASP